MIEVELEFEGERNYDLGSLNAQCDKQHKLETTFINSNDNNNIWSWYRVNKPTIH
jgi:hypothetical protein